MKGQQKGLVILNLDLKLDIWPRLSAIDST